MVSPLAHLLLGVLGAMGLGAENVGCGLRAMGAGSWGCRGLGVLEAQGAGGSGCQRLHAQGPPGLDALLELIPASCEGTTETPQRPRIKGQAAGHINSQDLSPPLQIRDSTAQALSLGKRHNYKDHIPSTCHLQALLQ